MMKKMIWIKLNIQTHQLKYIDFLLLDRNDFIIGTSFTNYLSLACFVVVITTLPPLLSSGQEYLLKYSSTLS